MRSGKTKRMASPLEFQLLVSALRMSQAGCARYLGVSQRTVARYLKGEAHVPAASVLLLRGLVAENIVPLVPRRTNHHKRTITMIKFLLLRSACLRHAVSVKAHYEMSFWRMQRISKRVMRSFRGSSRERYSNAPGLNWT